MTSQGTILLPGQGSQLASMPGELFIWKATGATTGGRLDSCEVELEPQVGPPEHIHHQHDEMFYVLEGNFRFKVAGEVNEGSRGTFVFIPRGVPHTWRCVGPGIGRLLIVFTPGGMEGYFRELSPLVPTLLAALPDLSKVDPSILAQADAIMKHYHYELVGPPLD